MEKQTAYLQVSALEVGYKSERVVRNVDFTLNKGELCGIVGVNGIGKSTLLRTIGNLQPRLKGSITIQNKDLQDFNTAELAKGISLVLTEPLASSNLTVKELIALGRQPYTNWIGTLTQEDESKIQNSVVDLELEGFSHRKCHELSDGQLQRVLIARTMAQDTPLILLDEPTTHLDLYHKVQILKLLKGLVQEHQKSIVFTTHEIDLAIQLCDRILILDGKQNPFGTPSTLIEQGCFETLFPTDMVHFDSQSGSYRVKK
ncbi:ABC transporter ATP-binding protein [Croceitalea sp. MTPC5]|uniref:ABC transporter ATP-binding protein n=1 Tax=Croceitalea sp. MTPC5 TaxID=3056565 RepID=UPI002B3E3CAD|nr:ABC transporter ATP-binding protein [Croceitalea sp. MTPC5]